MHQNWDALATQLTALINDEIVEVDVELIKRFISGYDLHISLEEPLFELGRQYISAEKLSEIGKVMANRRKA